MKYNANVLKTALPPIPQAVAWSRTFQPTPGKALINLHQGVPENAPPRPFLDRVAAASLDPAATKYGDIGGSAGLREALASDISSAYKGNVTADSIAVTGGCNMAFMASIMALAEAGDEVILPTPWYFNNAMTLEELGVTAVKLNTDEDTLFVPRVDIAETLITDKTRAIVLISPNNPSGSIYPPETLNAFFDLATKHNIALIVDETYRDFVPEGQLHRLFARPDWQTTLVHLYSFSKAYGIPGYRVGALVAAPDLVGQVAKILDCLQICPSQVVLPALEWGIDGLRDWRLSVKQQLDDRAAKFVAEMRKTAPNWHVVTIGGYFSLVKHPFQGVSSVDVARALAKTAGVVMLPGAFFETAQDSFLRVSIANVSTEVLLQVPSRLAKFSL